MRRSGYLAEAICVNLTENPQQWMPRTLHVERAGQRPPIAGPPAAVRDEVVSLRRAGARIWVREVVPATDDTRIGRADVVRAELWIRVRRALSRLPTILSSAGYARSRRMGRDETLMKAKATPLALTVAQLMVPW